MLTTSVIRAIPTELTGWSKCKWNYRYIDFGKIMLCDVVAHECPDTFTVCITATNSTGCLIYHLEKFKQGIITGTHLGDETGGSLAPFRIWVLSFLYNKKATHQGEVSSKTDP